MTGSPGLPALFPESRTGGPGGSCGGAEDSRAVGRGRGLPAPLRAGGGDRRGEGEGGRVHPAAACPGGRPANVAGGGGPRDRGRGLGPGGAAGRGRDRAGGDGGHAGLLAGLVLPAGGRRADRAAGELAACPAAGRAAEDRPEGRAVDRPAGRNGTAAALVRAAAGDPGAAGPDTDAATACPGPDQGVAAAGKAAGRRLGETVVGGALDGRDQDGPRHPGGHRRRRARPQSARGPGARQGEGRPRRRRVRPWRA